MNKILSALKILLISLGGLCLLMMVFVLIGFWMLMQGNSNQSWNMSYQESTPHFVVLHIEGPIMSAEPWSQYLREARDNEHCKGLILRINSPGGAVASSQEIYELVKDFQKHKKVIASFGDLAASGGYYAALGAPKIFANPGTLTGSIGVIMQFPRVHDFLGRFGLGMETIRGGEYKDAGSPFRDLTEGERQYFQGMIDDTHGQFREAVSRSRHIQGDELIKVSQGQVFSGRQALKNGLVDTLGTLDQAIKNLQESIKDGEKLSRVDLPPQKHWIEKIVESRADQQLVEKILKPLSKAGVFYMLPGYF